MVFNKRVYIVVFALFCFCKIFSQSSKLQKGKVLEDPSILKIKWRVPMSFDKKGKIQNVLSFNGVSYIEEKDFLPYLLLKESSKQGIKLKPDIQVILTETLTTQEEVCINPRYITENFEVIETKISTYRKVPFVLCKLVPIRINKTSGKLEKLVSYRIKWQQTPESLSSNQRSINKHSIAQSFAPSSVLGNGNKWYKIGTAENAIYKIDKAFLQSMGIKVGVGGINPKNIKLYGNGGEILSEANSDFHYDDLTENAIFVSDSGTIGVFDNNDYVLFYGQSPHKWNYNPGKNASTRYSRSKHYYSDSVFYFLTVDNSSPGKRISLQSDASAPANYNGTSFDDYAVHEIDEVNIMQSGRQFYGESFENTSSYSFAFPFLNLQSDTIWLKTDLIGTRTSGNGIFNISYPSGQYQVSFPAVCQPFECDLAAPVNGTGATHFIYNGSTGNNINIEVSTAYADETGWLNYIWVIVRRKLSMQGSQMTFRDYRSIGSGRISQFNLQSPSPTIRIWNVTNQFNITEQDTTFSSNNYSFTVATDTLQQFIAFDGTSYNTPAFIDTVSSQNLHSYRNVDYVIVAPQTYTAAAQTLGVLHNKPQNENLSYVIVTPDQIYNEFSSGAQDITAIRQFVRMLYNTSHPPRYLLLYGTGSYRQKDRYDPSNTILVPAYETYNSWSPLQSLTGDDFYALLDDDEGVIDINGNIDGLVDIGVGRIPAKTLDEANGVAQKTVQYYNRSEPTSSCCDQATQNTPDWRNWVSLIADDVQPYDPTDQFAWEIVFIQTQESNAGIIGENERYNIDKIYLDAYQQITVPGGLRHPDAVTALNNRVAKGALIIGYCGHGGTQNLSNTEVVSINQIQQWNNINNLALWFTATCQFSTYDNPAYESAGEDVLLNPSGGGIGLFTTTRSAYSTAGIDLGPTFYAVALDSLINGKRPTMGDIIRMTKQAPSAMNLINFCLLGDPAVTLSYPKQYTSPLKVNSHVYQSGVNDTLSALGKYTISGYVSDINGHQLSNFNGTMYMTVFDKPNALTTLDNSGYGIYGGINYAYPYTLQESVLFKGKSVITNGNFTFTFIVPKDIMYNFGLGKISYYAQSDTTDAAGYYEQIMVGGTSINPITDHQGPTINLYMNDNHFVSGGTTNQTPFIYALLADSSGVNTTGNGIGHGIEATVDANTAHKIVLDDYYQADLNKYQSGKLLYQLSSLPNGNHTLNLEAWDIVGNSSNTTIDFVVAQNAQIALSHVLNYPNPFSNSTKFYVEHNQACDYLNIEVEIFTITGKIVKTISQTVENQGFRTDGISWDGRDNYGDKLARGVYIYKVIVKNTDDGGKAEKIEKLVILN